MKYQLTIGTAIAASLMLSACFPKKITPPSTPAASIYDSSQYTAAGSTANLEGKWVLISEDYSGSTTSHDELDPTTVIDNQSFSGAKVRDVCDVTEVAADQYNVMCNSLMLAGAPFLDVTVSGATAVDSILGAMFTLTDNQNLTGSFSFTDTDTEVDGVAAGNNLITDTDVSMSFTMVKIAVLGASIGTVTATSDNTNVDIEDDIMNFTEIAFTDYLASYSGGEIFNGAAQFTIINGADAAAFPMHNSTTMLSYTQFSLAPAVVASLGPTSDNFIVMQTITTPASSQELSDADMGIDDVTLTATIGTSTVSAAQGSFTGTDSVEATFSAEYSVNF